MCCLHMSDAASAADHVLQSVKAYLTPSQTTPHDHLPSTTQSQKHSGPQKSHSHSSLNNSLNSLFTGFTISSHPVAFSILSGLSRFINTVASTFSPAMGLLKYPSSLATSTSTSPTQHVHPQHHTNPFQSHACQQHSGFSWRGTR
jgi:hypothetical protein